MYDIYATFHLEVNTWHRHIAEVSLLSAEQKDYELSSPSLTKIENRLGGKR